MGGPGKGALRRLDVAKAPVEADIAVVIVEPGRIVSDRHLGIGHHRQRLDLDDDPLGRLLRRVTRLGDHDGQDLADMADPAIGHNRPWRRDQGAAVAALQRQLAAQGPVAGARHVGGGVNREHARRRQCLTAIEMAQDAVRVVRAQRIREDLARQIDIVGEAAAAGDKLGILLAWHRLADAELEIGK